MTQTVYGLSIKKSYQEVHHLLEKKKKRSTTSKVVGSNADHQGSLWWVLTTQPHQTFPILCKWKRGRQMDFTFLPYVRLGQCLVTEENCTTRD